ncbi:MAG: glycosyltransferase family 4 protein [Lachnospiraceae bacterium]|nr:glycosyltransferase family 4 protein [Lachnospiraceae bacterium]
MKVLYISHDARLYGAPKSLLEFVRGMKKKGIDPVVIIPSKGDLQIELDKSKIANVIIPYYSCVYLGEYHAGDYVKYVWTNFKAVMRIRKLIKKERIELVHTNTLAVSVGAVAAYLLKIPHVWHFREYLKEDFDFKRLNAEMIYKLVQKSKCCIAIAEGIERKYHKEYGIKPVRLYDGIECSLYEYPVNFEENVKEKPELLLAGAISEGKGQWDAVRAVEILVNRGVEVHLSIVGNGDPALMKALKRYVRRKGLTEYIIFRPFTRSLQKLRVHSTIVLVCSRMEAFGRVTAEAMLSGKIVIGTDTGGTVELIGKNEERGYLYRYNHPDELAKKIEYVLLNRQEVIKKEKKAQLFIKNLTDMDYYTDRMLQIYKKAVIK